MTLSILAEDGFIHPGLLHGNSDLERIRMAVDLKKGPIFDGFKILEKSPYAKEGYRMRGPFPKSVSYTHLRAHET